MGEYIQQAPLSEQITALHTAYEAGDIDWHTYSLQGIHLAAQRFDEVVINNGGEPVHVNILTELLASPTAKKAWNNGWSGNPPISDAFGHERANDYVTIQQAITRQFGPGYIPEYLMKEILFDQDTSGHLRSRAEAVLRASRSEQPIPEPYFALFMLDLLAWNSVRHVHDQYQKNIDLKISPYAQTGKERELWSGKVEAFQRYSGFATKSLAAIRAKSEELWGQKGHAALDAFRAMTFLKRRAFAKEGKAPGTFRIEIMRLLAAGQVDDANARVSELVNGNPEYFSERTKRMYVIDTA